MSSSEKPVLVFDSGVGGLSVVKHLRAVMPDRPLVYCCDNQALPYGTKPDAWLVQRIVDICTQAVQTVQACALVVACNTASTLALTPLRQVLDIPVVGTVPAIKPAVGLSKSGVIGLLATSATTRRPYTDQLIANFAQGARVIKVAADALVTEAERIAQGLVPNMSVIAAAIAPLWTESELDTVVLGCTHFPLLKENLAALAPAHVRFIDSGAAIARRTQAVAPTANIRNSARASNAGGAIHGAGLEWESTELISASGSATVSSLSPSLSSAPDAAGLATTLRRFGFAPPRVLTIALPLPDQAG